MIENIEIVIAQLHGTIDSTIVKGYSLKKAKKIIQVKAEILMPNINKETMQAVLKLLESKFKFDKDLESLKQALFKQRNALNSDKLSVLTSYKKANAYEENA